MIKRDIWLAVGILAMCLAACNTRPVVQKPTPTRTAETESYAQPAPGNIAANGVLQPAHQIQSSFGLGGRVKSVEIELGDLVKSGQTLATLDDTELQRAVAEAKLELESAQAQLDQLQAQATPIPEGVLAATAAMSSAQTALREARVQAGQRSNQDIIDRDALEKAKRALADAQSEYDKVRNDPFTRDWAPSSPQGKALDDMRDYYNVVVAQYKLHAANHGYELAIANAQAQLAQAQLGLYEAQHPVRPEALRLAQLDVERARKTLEAAQADLKRTTLAAPFDGVVSAVGLRVGEWALPGALAVELLDVSRWRVETKNVGELQIARVQAGQEVLVRVNAFKGETLRGHVLTISPVAVVQQGDTTYTLTIELEPTDLNLRPGMTAQVEIVVE